MYKTQLFYKTAAKYITDTSNIAKALDSRAKKLVKLRDNYDKNPIPFEKLYERTSKQTHYIKDKAFGKWFTGKKGTPEYKEAKKRNYALSDMFEGLGRKHKIHLGGMYYAPKRDKNGNEI